MYLLFYLGLFLHPLIMPVGLKGEYGMVCKVEMAVEKCKAICRGKKRLDPGAMKKSLSLPFILLEVEWLFHL